MRHALHAAVCLSLLSSPALGQDADAFHASYIAYKARLGLKFSPEEDRRVLEAAASGSCAAMMEEATAAGEREFPLSAIELFSPEWNRYMSERTALLSACDKAAQREVALAEADWPGFIARYARWKAHFAMSPFSLKDEQRILRTVEAGDCAFANTLLFSAGYVYIPDRVNYSGAQVKLFGWSVDRLVEYCQTMKDTSRLREHRKTQHQVHGP